jgi:hypothetical protein
MSEYAASLPIPAHLHLHIPFDALISLIASFLVAASIPVDEQHAV